MKPTKQPLSSVKRPTRKQIRAARMTEDIARLGENYDVMKRTGLEKSPAAKDLLKTRNAVIYDRDRLLEENERDKRLIVELLLQCFAMCDGVCTSVEMLYDKLKEVYGDLRDAEVDFGELLKNAAKTTGDIVTYIDHAHSFKMSMAYAAMAEEVIAEVMKVAHKVIKKHHDADNGNNLSYKK